MEGILEVICWFWVPGLISILPFRVEGLGLRPPQHCVHLLQQHCGTDPWQDCVGDTGESAPRLAHAVLPAGAWGQHVLLWVAWHGQPRAGLASLSFCR